MYDNTFVYRSSCLFNSTWGLRQLPTLSLPYFMLCRSWFYITNIHKIPQIQSKIWCFWRFCTFSFSAVCCRYRMYWIFLISHIQVQLPVLYCKYLAEGRPFMASLYAVSSTSMLSQFKWMEHWWWGPGLWSGVGRARKFGSLSRATVKSTFVNLS